jgi:ABC-2 type transport system ATP-binding protein
MDRLPGVHGLVVDGGRVDLQADNDGLGALLHALSGAGVRSLTCRPPTLEELFLRHYESGDAAGHDGPRRAGPGTGDAAGTGTGACTGHAAETGPLPKAPR